MSQKDADKRAADEHGRRKALVEIRSMWPSESRGAMALHFEKSFLAGCAHARQSLAAKVEALEKVVDAAKDLRNYGDLDPGYGPDELLISAIEDLESLELAEAKKGKEGET